MKTCTVCGHSNEDTAIYCQQCGAGEFRAQNTDSVLDAEETMPTPPPGPPDEWVAILVPKDQFKATIIAGRLEASGINARIVSQKVGGWGTMQTFLDVQVQRRDFAEAKTVLSETDPAPPDSASRPPFL